jgi:hypothetical protein
MKNAMDRGKLEMHSQSHGMASIRFLGFIWFLDHQGMNAVPIIPWPIMVWVLSGKTHNYFNSAAKSLNMSQIARRDPELGILAVHGNHGDFPSHELYWEAAIDIGLSSLFLLWRSAKTWRDISEPKFRFSNSWRRFYAQMCPSLWDQLVRCEFSFMATLRSLTTDFWIVSGEVTMIEILWILDRSRVISGSVKRSGPSERNHSRSVVMNIHQSFKYVHVDDCRTIDILMNTSSIGHEILGICTFHLIWRKPTQLWVRD